MSKYMYTTVYEEFTGIKPPIPKEHKPKRKRSFGHPYRMRLNMKNADSSNDEKPQQHFTKEDPSFGNHEHSANPCNYLVSPERIEREEPELCMTEASPRVTYKKRRHVYHDAYSHDTHV